jgi:hypothetical protein
MKLKPNANGISIKYYLGAIAVGGLLGVPALAYGATAMAPQAPAYKSSAHVKAAPMTKAEVLSELRQAKRMGNFVVNAETGKKAYQARPSAYPGHEMQPHKSRAEVLIELRQARRNGNYIVNAETGRKANGEIAGWG